MSRIVEIVFPVPRSPSSAHMGECSSSEPRAHDTRRSTASEVYASLLRFKGASSLRGSSNTPTTARVGTTFFVSGARSPHLNSASATSSEITGSFAEIGDLLFLTSFKICSFDANKSFSAALSNSEDRGATLTYCFSTTSTSSLKYGSASCSISSWRSQARFRSKSEKLSGFSTASINSLSSLVILSRRDFASLATTSRSSLLTVGRSYMLRILLVRTLLICSATSLLTSLPLFLISDRTSLHAFSAVSPASTSSPAPLAFSRNLPRAQLSSATFEDT